MKGRLPIVLSLTALLIAVAGTTPLGEAASDAIPRFARNADKVDGLHASRTPKAGRLLALNRQRKFPTSVLPAATGLTGLETVSQASAQDSATPKVLVLNCPAGKRPVASGYRVTGGGNANIAVTESYPSSASQWTIRAVEQSAVASWALTGYVLCVAGT
jgi:hypothetical protein